MDAAGSGRKDIWVTVTDELRHVYVQLEHFDGTEWEVVDPDVRSYGWLATASDGDTWLFSEGAIRRLGSKDPPLDTSWWPPFASLWIGTDAVWLSTPEQAQRHPR